MAIKKKAVDFEASMIELETVIEAMESGELGLEESLAHFERGVALTRSCQQALSSAQQKVDQLIEKNGELTMIAFEGDDDE